MRTKKPKIINLDGNAMPFVSVRLIAEEALRVAKSKRAMVILNYNNAKIEITKDKSVQDIVTEYFDI